MTNFEERRLRAAAFGASPGADVWAAVSADGRLRWLAAVVLGGQGHYAAAAAVLTELMNHPDKVLASLAASTLASHRRQLGGHALARPLDAMALRLAGAATRATTDLDGVDLDGVDLAGATVDALIGLAADAIGLGQLSSASRLLAAARRQAAAGTVSWRISVRLGWLAAEVELGADRPPAAIPPAERAVAIARSRGAVRHLLKSELVLAAALATDGQHDRASGLLRDVTGLGNRYGLLPLVWPASFLLSRQPPEVAGEPALRHCDRAVAALNLVFRHADAPLRAAAKRSPSVPSDVLQTGDWTERSSADEVHDEFVCRLCQGSTPRDR